MYMIKEMFKEDRPREKMINNGVETLTNIEIIALILRSGNKNTSVIDLSKKVLDKLEKIQDLKEITIDYLMTIPGIKVAKATTLLAAIELGKRLEVVNRLNYQILTSHDVYNLMKDIRKEEQENLYCIYLNTKMFVIKRELIYIGTVNQIAIHPREIFKNAVRLNASFIIISHNHPTGDASPSNADIMTTKTLENAGEMLNILILDHIIIGNEEFYSFKEKQKFILWLI